MANQYKLNPFTGELDIVSAGGVSAGTWGAATTVVIAAGVAALTGAGYYLIDTEGAAVTDDLIQITGLSAGDVVILAPANDARTVVVKDGVKIQLQGIDFSLDSQYDRIGLQSVDGDICVEFPSRVSNG